MPLELVAPIKPPEAATLALELRDLANRAEAGEFVGILAVLLGPDSSTLSVRRGKFTTTKECLGMLEIIKFDMLRDSVDD